MRGGGAKQRVYDQRTAAIAAPAATRADHPTAARAGAADLCSPCSADPPGATAPVMVGCGILYVVENARVVVWVNAVFFLPAEGEMLNATEVDVVAKGVPTTPGLAVESGTSVAVAGMVESPMVVVWVKAVMDAMAAVGSPSTTSKVSDIPIAWV